MMVKFINYKWRLVLYSICTALLVQLHISHTQKWAAPFPCSKTKSQISFSHGWAQEGHRCSLRRNICHPATDSCSCLYNYVNIYTPSVASGSQLTSTTHFSYSSKYRRTSLHKTYHRLFDFSNQTVRVMSITSRRISLSIEQKSLISSRDEIKRCIAAKMDKGMKRF